MSHQVYFYMTPRDVSGWERSVCGGECVLMHGTSSTSALPVIVSMSDEQTRHQSLSFYLARRADVDKVTLRYVSEQKHWVVEGRTSPVIDVFCSYYDGKILRRGRLYYVDQILDDGREWIPHSAEFRGWAKGLLERTKKHLRRMPDGDYIGEDAASWLKASGGRLVQF